MAKPKLIPLQQWYCDTCDELIGKPEEGWLEWMVDEERQGYGYRICHHFLASPISKAAGGQVTVQGWRCAADGGHANWAA
jgi:hypothetical protein